MTRCSGLEPLPSRRFSLLDAVEASPNQLAELVGEYGSPLNLLDPVPMAANHQELSDAAERCGVPLRVFFARKANKSISLMHRALELGLGVDVASERELEQALAAGATGQDLIVTAAVKTPALLRTAAAAGAVVALDHEEEVDGWLAATSGVASAPVALRLAPALPHGIPTRFGLEAGDAARVAERPELAGSIVGVQFHLDGYSAPDRGLAATQALELIDHLRERGHPVRFLDIGGGIPMRYVDDGSAWERFWLRHRAALLDETKPSMTFRRHGLGLHVVDGKLGGAPAVYPVAQSRIRGAWLEAVLGERGPCGRALSDRLRERGLELRCEPGRSLLDGCGVTVGSVAFTKTAVDGLPLVGLEMNRTQLRSAADDFLVDPVLVRPSAVTVPSAGPQQANLVGAYCIERELITWRTLQFPEGVTRGDLLVFPNTAGYMMHILESASHQIPLAANVVVGVDDGVLTGHERDAIDRVSPLRP